MHLLFLDPLAPLAYDLRTLKEKGLGGTEATVLRVSAALKEQHDITIAQPCRKPEENLNCEGIHFVSLEAIADLKPEVVILLRDYRRTEAVAKCFPGARKLLWLHNLPSKGLHKAGRTIAADGYDIIAVSNFHRRAIEARLRGKWFQRLLGAKPPAIPVHVLYNPIDENLKPEEKPWKPEQLLFMSSPHKGLAQTLQVFKKIRKQFPEYRLLISNPGYLESTLRLPEEASLLGALPHAQTIELLRESFCVFYPQYERMETFGLVYAEANAVGTPVLAHDAGAASEVLSDPDQLVNGRQFEDIIAKLKAWRKKRPTVRAKEEFRISQVKQAWLQLLAASSRGQAGDDV